MKTFLQFLREALDIKYILPKDKKNILFDFYMSTSLTSEDDHLQQEIDYVKGKLYPALKDDMLEAVFFAISAEVRHVYDKNSTREITLAAENKNIIDTFKIWNKYYGDEDNVVDTNSTETKLGKVEQHNEKERLFSYKAATRVNNQRNFVEMSKIFFGDSHLKWNSDFGGDPWIKICEGWLKLDEAKTIQI